MNNYEYTYAKWLERTIIVLFLLLLIIGAIIFVRLLLSPRAYRGAKPDVAQIDPDQAIAPVAENKPKQPAPQPELAEPPYQSSFKDIFGAAGHGIVRDVEFFINNGADVNERYPAEIYNESPLHLAAARNPHVEVLRYLVSRGADINAKNNAGSIPAINAAGLNPNIDVLKYFMSLGTDVNAKNNVGATLLHYAAGHNPNIEVLEYLITLPGIDINAKFDGRTPLDLANTEERKAIIRAAGGRSGQ